MPGCSLEGFTFGEYEPQLLPVCPTPVFGVQRPTWTPSQVLSLGVLWVSGPSGAFLPHWPASEGGAGKCVGLPRPLEGQHHTVAGPGPQRWASTAVDVFTAE